MVDATLVYVTGVVVLFFFWIYGVVAFLRDAKNWLVPAYRQWRADDARGGPDAEDRAGEAGATSPRRSRNVEE